jgi:hypothetical protein
VAGAPFVALEKLAVVIVKPKPLMFTHSFKLEFHSFIWKLYKPLSRASTKVVPTVEEHSD